MGSRNLADLFELRDLSALLQKAFELDVDVEVVFDGVLPAAGDDDDVGDAGLGGFLDPVLNDRLVHEHEHFLRLRFGGRQKSGSKPCCREDGLADRCGHLRHPIVASW